MLICMAGWHSLEPVDASFFTAAPVLHRFPVKLTVSPQRVWESLASERSVADWGMGVTVRWTSPRPFALGATREVVLPARSMTVREEFFRWDEGSGYSFFVREANRPGFVGLAENYEVVADRSGTLLTWTIAIEPGPALARALRTGGPLAKAAFARFPRAAKSYFATHP